jgi:hypothetical protein
MLPLIAFSLRLRGFKYTKEALQNKLPLNSPPGMTEEDTAEILNRACRMVRAAARYGIFRPTCLVESLALWYLLQKQRIPAQLRIGVRRLPEKFEAHAWVEYQGVALNQSEEEHRHYAAFDSGLSNLPGEKE